MPNITTTASLSKNGFFAPTNNWTAIDWLGVFDTTKNQNTIGTVASRKNYPYIFGTSGSGIYRPFYGVMNIPNGNTSNYKLFADVSNTASTATILNVVVDSANNSHVLFGSVTSQAIVLAKYDSSGNFIDGITIAGSSINLGNPVTMVIDTSNNIYIASANNSNNAAYITKISTSYTISWCNSYDFGSPYSITATSASLALLIDSSNNIFLAAGSAGGSGLNAVVKISSAGTVIWRTGTNYTQSLSGRRCCLDSSGNFYILYTITTPSIITKLVKIDSSGTKIYEYTIPFGAGIGLYMATTTGNNLVMSSASNPSTTTPTTMLCITDISTTPVRLNTTSWTTSTDLMTVNSISSSLYGTYIGLEFRNNPSLPNSKTTLGVMKLPSNLGVSGTSSWNFTITNDDLVSYVFNGSITFSNTTGGALTSTSVVTFYTPVLTVSAVTATTSTITPGSNSTVPFTYSTSIV